MPVGRSLRALCFAINNTASAAKRLQIVRPRRWTSTAERAKIETRKQVGKENFLTHLSEHPGILGNYTPQSLKETLERMGYKVSPLTQGRLKEVTFEAGGGYKVNFTDSGLLMYHPKWYSHHGKAYYKISTGKRGLHRYELDGKEKDGR